MKKTISMYWPLAIVLPLAAAAYVHICSDAASRATQSPLAAGQFSAELARAVSYGLVGDDASMPAKSLREATMMPAVQTAL
ncbi:hypothetical protein [Paraburkholderia saeva]|uniref:DUF4148 domain-containing protein n=1 Tax=Paraburkholderia saeva TaxID=2777537 RepID=A0A9N8RWZ4_9BURK|nr:hypothetical protein [Paraburkholderia saeva]CAG4892701.1 hypothetical protein R70241_01404 [Paraburkholderia saeva]CAG4898728.1 hypothetical protein LMG31841_02663 [Paraburkholderia saeva]CAG4900144.1 hypothetical protein R52603_02700 [Paraburkholderia saeva]